MTSARTIARTLYSGAKPSGGGWLTRCPVPTHGNGKGDRNPSLLVTDGETRPLYTCFGGCPSTAVADEIRHRGLVEVEERETGRTECQGSRDDEQVRTDKARSIWGEADSPPFAYLTTRGISVAPPPSIRWHRSLAYDRTTFYPAMVAAVQGDDGRLVAVHRTFLTPDATGKAPVAAPKKALGSIRGGAVRLAKAGATLLLAEGIEDALSLVEMTGHPTWAVLGTSGFYNVILPDAVETVILAPDGDPAGEKVVSRAAERFAAEGRQVLHLRPPADMDWNDCLVAWHERAAIGEHDGGIPPDTAERQAFLDVLGWEVRHVGN
ncbi:DUF7146 domain-containing protein [Thalassobaculum litoreum]|uniref:Toprim domain-containing protein n=1 Tax=Thalassobaculum litoreum DSM 18839 TaxID=1123362 RepID=A0A8G2BEV2_9PROT|nr:toprim domain-containing protein [Thalassobaculum litoreum]SDF15502.1 Toprim domain-containing protein [Thalassobaculum litoreum DSM 18839]